LYDTLGSNAVTFILNSAEIEVVIVDNEERLRALTLESRHLKRLKHVILLNDVPETMKRKVIENGFKVHTMAEIEENGRQHLAVLTVSDTCHGLLTT